MNSTALLLTCWLVGCAGGNAAKKAETTTPAELSPAEQVRMAQSLVRAGRMHDALRQLEEAIARHPQETTLRQTFGKYAFLAGRYDEAERELKKALELDPYRTDVHNDLGLVYDKLDRGGDAEREYRAALADPAYPTPQKVCMNLGVLYRSQGRSLDAIDAFRRAVEIEPRFFQGHFELAMTLSEAGELEEAAREFEVAEPGYRDVGDFHYQLGFTYFRLGRTDSARDSLRRVINVAPGSPSAAKADELLKVMR
jgi:Tfp pilus assembly protein PilF